MYTLHMRKYSVIKVFLYFVKFGELTAFLPSVGPSPLHVTAHTAGIKAVGWFVSLRGSNWN